MRSQTYIFLQKLKCPKCGRILAGGASHKIKADKRYYYYRCEKVEVILENMKLKTQLKNYYQIYLNMIQLLMNSSYQYYKIRYIIQKKVLENEQVSKLNLTVDDILVKRDMDFINSIKLPILYNAFVDSCNGLEREEKAEIVMRYIDDIELELVNNKYKVKLTNFKSTFYKDFKSLFNKGYIDWKRKTVHSFNGICVDGKVRYSEYLPAKEVYRHLMRLNECYEVAFYKGTLYKKTEELKMLPLHKGDVVVRIFPTENDDDSKEILGMGMFVTKDSPNDIKVDIPDLFECIPNIED